MLTPRIESVARHDKCNNVDIDEAARRRRRGAARKSHNFARRNCQRSSILSRGFLILHVTAKAYTRRETATTTAMGHARSTFADRSLAAIRASIIARAMASSCKFTPDARRAMQSLIASTAEKAIRLSCQILKIRNRNRD